MGVRLSRAYTHPFCETFRAPRRPQDADHAIELDWGNLDMSPTRPCVRGLAMSRGKCRFLGVSGGAMVGMILTRGEIIL